MPSKSRELWLALDADDNLYPWVAPFRAGLDAFRDRLVQYGLDKNVVEADMRHAVGERRILDDPAFLQYMPCIQELNLGEKEFERLVKDLYEHFKAARDALDGPFDGVVDTIRELSEMEVDGMPVRMAITSNAPLLFAAERARRFLGDVLDKIEFVGGQYPPNPETLIAHRKRMLMKLATKMRVVPLDNKKPNLDYSELFGMTRADVERLVVTVGDSVESDVGNAAWQKNRVILTEEGRGPANDLLGLKVYVPKRKPSPHGHFAQVRDLMQRGKMKRSPHFHNVPSILRNW